MNLKFWDKERSVTYPTLALEDYANQLNYMLYNGLEYQLLGNQTHDGARQEEIGGDFVGLVRGMYKSNGVIFACMLARMLLFAEARFQFRQMRNGRPGDLFGTADLQILETPWQGGTTGDLLTRAIQDADLAGNFFCVRRPNGLKRLRPDWVDIVIGSSTDDSVSVVDIDAEVLGYAYWPGGRNSGNDPVPLLKNQVAHFAPIPDPEASYRGMSWLTPVIREVMGDSAARDHKLKFFEKGATPNLFVKIDPSSMSKDQFDLFVEVFKAKHEGMGNAYSTLFLRAAADATVIGADFKQMDFKVTQGAGETRIAAAAGVPPVIVGLSEGLAAATYSNYAQSIRRFTDLTMRPLWRNMSGSLAQVVTVPGGSELWYDDRDIPALAEDQKDMAEIQQLQAQAIKALVDAGFESDSVITAITSDDLSRLVHTGLFSVQLQPAGTQMPTEGPIPAPTNGTTAPAA